MGLLAVALVALPHRAAMAPLWPVPSPLPRGAVTRCNETPECYRVCANTVGNHAKITGWGYALIPAYGNDGKLQGVHVHAKGPGTLFALLGVVFTDVLVRVDDQELDSIDVVMGALERARAKPKVRYEFLREGRSRVLTVLNRKC